MPIHESRVFATTCEDVFSAFSHQDRLMRWYGPKGFTSTFYEFDFRADGLWTFDLIGPDDVVYPNHNVFRLIDHGRRIVFDHIQDGHDFQLDFSLSEADGGCRLDWTMTFADPVHESEIMDFIKEKNAENFDRLEAELARNRQA